MVGIGLERDRASRGMRWVLRPFISDPTLAPQFLREKAWGKAHVVVRMIRDVLTRCRLASCCRRVGGFGVDAQVLDRP